MAKRTRKTATRHNRRHHLNMAGYLIAEEGPLTGLIISFEEGTEWILGRDPDESTTILEDPKVSRKHIICRKVNEDGLDGFLLENLSSINPTTHNGQIITEPVLLEEGDILQIGNSFFRFTENKPEEKQITDNFIQENLDELEEENLNELEEEIAPNIEEDPLSAISFDMPKSGRWLLKVISGPNAGAEFSLQTSSSYILGRDSDVSEVVFHDLSVSRQHAKITVDSEDKLFIEDLQTRNGVIVNGELITAPKELSSQDLIAVGTTSFLVIDREQIHETIISPPSGPIFKPEEIADKESPSSEIPKIEQTPPLEPEETKSWKDLIISTKHLAAAGLFTILLLILITASFSLFRSEPITTPEYPEAALLQDALKPFPSIHYSFSDSTGKLFLIGHVLTSIEKQELSYTLSTLPFLRSVEDTVIIDELVWQNMNALFLSYPEWQAITVHSPAPGKFVLRGYVQTLEQAQLLSEYVNANFPYPDLLDNQVVIGNNLTMQIQSRLIEQGFGSITFQVTNGELVLTGRIAEDRASDFSHLTKQLQTLPGIRLIQNYVIYSKEDTSRIDLSSQYNVTGFSTGNNNEQFVVINQKIFATGDFLQGMKITEITPDVIFLEKDGIKFKINYNLQ